MTTKRVFSKNADYQKFEVLKSNRNKRYKYYEFFVEGVRNLNEAVNSGWHISSFLYSPEKPLSSWAKSMLENVKTDLNYELSDELMQELSGKEDTSELMAVVRMRDDETSQIKLSDSPLLAIFDRPSNKGNLGTLIRSCDSLGIDGLVITGHAVDLYDPDVIVSSMGSFFKVPVIRISETAAVVSWLESLRAEYPQLQIIGSTSHKQKNIYELDFKRPTVFMIGNETEGLCTKFKEIADEMTTIPMSESCCASSFNVACASTVLFYEAVRQRKLSEKI